VKVISKKTDLLITIAAVILILVSVFYLGGLKTRNDIDSHYSRLNLPSILHQTSKEWTAGGPDVNANWEYKYKTESDRSSTYNVLVNFLRNDGYHVSVDEGIGKDSIIASNKSQNLYLTINLNPKTEITPSKNVTSVVITAEKIPSGL
jgi:hypothetical protein